jgi:hypothetical protein
MEIVDRVRKYQCTNIPSIDGGRDAAIRRVVRGAYEYPPPLSRVLGAALEVRVGLLIDT